VYSNKYRYIIIHVLSNHLYKGMTKNIFTN